LITLQNWSFGQKKLLVATEVRQPAPTTRLRFYILKGRGGGGGGGGVGFFFFFLEIFKKKIKKSKKKKKKKP
jgi:hypothetical protein